MAGYSGTPLPRKLGIKPGQNLALLHAPEEFAALLELDHTAHVRQRLTGSTLFDVVILFARRQSALTRAFPKAAARLKPHGGLWVAWLKKSSGAATDLDEATVRTYGLSQGLVDNKICAIDEAWSGLRFVIRLKDRKPSPDEG
jgi:hypothetical protein